MSIATITLILSIITAIGLVMTLGELVVLAKANLRTTELLARVQRRLIELLAAQESHLVSGPLEKTPLPAGGNTSRVPGGSS